MMKAQEVERRRCLHPEHINDIILSRSLMKYPIVSFLAKETPDGYEAPLDPDTNQEERFLVWYSGPTTRVVRRTFLDAGFACAPTESNSWHVCWGSPKGVQFYSTLAPGQYCNQIPGSNSMGRKDTLALYIEERALQFAEDFDIIPKTFVLPQNAEALTIDMNSYPGSFYIYKPAMGARGNGIELLRGCDQVCSMETAAVVQEYIRNPLLIHGFKFDFRVYACVTSIDPLIVYVYEEGLGRFATTPYEAPTPKNERNVTMHLTNFSVNSKSANFIDRDKGAGAVRGAQDLSQQVIQNDDIVVDIMDDFPSKWMLENLLDYMDERADSFNGGFQPGSGKLKEYILEEIRLIVKKTFIACEPRLYAFAHQAGTANAYPRRNFGMYGFDIILNSDLTLLLIEVNSSPATGTATELDVQLKFPLCAELMHLIGIGATFCDDGLIYVPERLVDDEKEKEPRKKNVAGEFTGDVEFTHNISSKNINWQGLSAFEKRCLLQLEDEASRLGRWVRVFPDAEEGELCWFEQQRYLNTLACKYLAAGVDKHVLLE